MRILLFGATGMVGQGVLRECLRAADIDLVQTVGRSGTGLSDPKLREIVHGDLFDYAGIEQELNDFDACFFCLGVSSGGMKEADYLHMTYDLTLAAAGTLARLNPQMRFVYVSGAGTDSSEKGRSMWARIKGRTENALRALPFAGVYLFRPGMIQPLHGARSKTASYRIIYDILKPVLGLLRRIAPTLVLTTENVGQAMLSVARHGWPQPTLEAADILAASRATG